MRKDRQAGEKIALRTFAVEMAGVQAPRWVWWVALIILLLPLRATVGL